MISEVSRDGLGRFIFSAHNVMVTALGFECEVAVTEYREAHSRGQNEVK